MSHYPRSYGSLPTARLSVVDDRADTGAERPAQVGAERAQPLHRDPGASEMEQLRELLLGDQRREVERRLRELEAQQGETLERLRAEQQEHFEQVESLLRGELARLSRAQRRDREERGVSVQQLSERLDGLAKTLTQAINSGLESVRDGLAGESCAREAALLKQTSALESMIERRIQALESELQQERERLRQMKADRDELLDLFSEVAQRLNRQLELPAP